MATDIFRSQKCEGMEMHASLQINTPNNTNNNNNKDDATRLYLHLNEFTATVSLRLAGDVLV